MKVLKFLVGGVMVLLIAFWLVGIFTDSVKTECSVIIDKPVDETFDAIMYDVEMGDWMTGFKSFDPIDTSMGYVGSKHKLVIEEGGQEYEFIETITGFAYGMFYSFEIENEFFISSTEIIFDDVDGKTKMTSTTVTKGKGFVFRSMMPFMKKSWEAREKADYDKLKEVIEAS